MHEVPFTQHAITVVGRASAQVAPDVVDVLLRVRAERRRRADLAEEIGRRAEALRQVLDDFNGAIGTRVTTAVRMMPANPGRGTGGFVAEQTVQCEVREIVTFPELVARAVEGAGAEVQLVGHRVDDTNPAALDACHRAAEDAHRRAVAFATGAGACITELAWAREPTRTDFFNAGARTIVAQSLERGGSVEAAPHLDLSGDILTIAVEIEAAFWFRPRAPHEGPDGATRVLSAVPPMAPQDAPPAHPHPSAPGGPQGSSE